MTSQAYQNYKDRLFGLTFNERMLTLHHVLSEPEMIAWVEKAQKTMKMRLKPTITVDDIETNIREIPPRFLKLIEIQAKEFSYRSIECEQDSGFSSDGNRDYNELVLLDRWNTTSAYIIGIAIIRKELVRFRT